MRRPPTVLLVALAVTAGCSAASDGRAPATEGAAADGAAAEAAAAGDAADGALVYDCFGVGGTAAEILDGPSLDTVADHPGHDTFVAEAGGADGWVVLEADDDTLAAIRELAVPDELGPDVRTHERAAVELLPAASLPDADEDTWMLTSAGACALQAQLEGLGAASVALDANAPAAPEDTEVALLVNELACASGEDARGRVHLVDLDLDDDTVRIVVGVQPKDGSQTCPSHPWTPVVVELPEPLGDRSMVDAAVLPPRELTPVHRGRGS